MTSTSKTIRIFLIALTCFAAEAANPPKTIFTGTNQETNTSITYDLGGQYE